MSSSSSLSISTEIQSIFEQNKLEDLKQFIKKRNCLNSYSMFLVYFFHIIQSAGILTTTIAAGYDNKTIIWVGVGLNLLASLINIFEKTNNAISKNILKDIEKPTIKKKVSKIISDNDSDSDSGVEPAIIVNKTIVKQTNVKPTEIDKQEIDKLLQDIKNDKTDKLTDIDSIKRDIISCLGLI